MALPGGGRRRERTSRRGIGPLRREMLTPRPARPASTVPSPIAPTVCRDVSVETWASSRGWTRRGDVVRAPPSAEGSPVTPGDFAPVATAREKCSRRKPPQPPPPPQPPRPHRLRARNTPWARHPNRYTPSEDAARRSRPKIRVVRGNRRRAGDRPSVPAFRASLVPTPSPDRDPDLDSWTGSSGSPPRWSVPRPRSMRLSPWPPPPSPWPPRVPP